MELELRAGEGEALGQIEAVMVFLMVVVETDVVVTSQAATEAVDVTKLMVTTVLADCVNLVV